MIPRRQIMQGLRILVGLWVLLIFQIPVPGKSGTLVTSQELSQTNFYIGIKEGHNVLVDPLGSRAPGFEKIWTIDNHFIKLQRPSKITIWHFFSRDCHLCNEELPRLEKFYQAHKNQIYLIAFGVGKTDDKKSLQKYQRELQLSFPIVSIENIPKDYSTLPFIMGVCIPHLKDSLITCKVPATYIINQNGVIQFVNRSEGNWSLNSSLEEIVLEILKGNQEEADEDFKQYLEKFKNAKVEELNELAWMLAMNKLYLDSAKQLAEKAVELEPENPEYNGTLGTLYYLKGNFDQAEFYLEKAISLRGSNNPEIQAVDIFYLGMVRLAQGDICSAKKLLQQSIRLNDHSFWTILNIGIQLKINNLVKDCENRPSPSPSSLTENPKIPL